MGESAGEGLWLLALVTGGRWHVTGGRWHVTHDTWHETCHMWYVTPATRDMIFFKQKVTKCERKKCKKRAKKCPRVQKSFQKAGFHSFGATIRTRRESRCLRYALFLYVLVKKFWLIKVFMWSKNLKKVFWWTFLFE